MRTKLIVKVIGAFRTLYAELCIGGFLPNRIGRYRILDQLQTWQEQFSE
jgi:hypothetical protein